MTTVSITITSVLVYLLNSYNITLQAAFLVSFVLFLWCDRKCTSLPAVTGGHSTRGNSNLTSPVKPSNQPDCCAHHPDELSNLAGKLRNSTLDELRWEEQRNGKHHQLYEGTCKGPQHSVLDIRHCAD